MISAMTCRQKRGAEQLHGRRGTTAGVSSRRPQERSEVGDWPEVRQFVGVDDRADACDLTAGDIERRHADQPLQCVEIERSRAAVDLDGRNDTPEGGRPGGPS
jgi:hypothetical protein